MSTPTVRTKVMEIVMSFVPSDFRGSVNVGDYHWDIYEFPYNKLNPNKYGKMYMALRLGDAASDGNRQCIVGALGESIPEVKQKLFTNMN